MPRITRATPHMEDLEDYKVHLVSIGIIEQQSRQEGQAGTLIIHAVVKRILL